MPQANEGPRSLAIQPGPETIPEPIWNPLEPTRIGSVMVPGHDRRAQDSGLKWCAVRQPENDHLHNSHLPKGNFTGDAAGAGKLKIGVRVKNKTRDPTSAPMPKIWAPGFGFRAVGGRIPTPG